jgi:hypothetical protein
MMAHVSNALNVVGHACQRQVVTTSVSAAAQEAGPMAEQLQVLQIALINEECTAAQQTAPMAEDMWRRHLQVRQLHQADASRLGAVCAQCCQCNALRWLRGPILACRTGRVNLQLQPGALLLPWTLPSHLPCLRRLMQPQRSILSRPAPQRRSRQLARSQDQRALQRMWLLLQMVSETTTTTHWVPQRLTRLAAVLPQAMTA